MRARFEARLVKNRKRIAFVVLITIGCFCAIAAGIRLATIQTEYAASREEYEQLREAFVPAEAIDTIPEGMDKETLIRDAPSVVGTEAATANVLYGLIEINPDLVGWIRIENTVIDYPVVRGEDNERYINTSFSGDRNSSGAIFMDALCENAFEASHAILYGHNMKDGSMFSELDRFLDEEYRKEHPEIIIYTLDGETLTFHVFSVQNSDIWNPAYTLGFENAATIMEYYQMLGVEQSAKCILTLSTCIGDSGGDRRLLVHAILY